MGDTGGAPTGGVPGGGVPGGGVPGGGVAGGGAPNKAQSSMENLLGALGTLMEQQRRQPTRGYGSTKALKGVADKIGRFDGKNVTSFLKVYLCEMEVHQIPEDSMI